MQLSAVRLFVRNIAQAKSFYTGLGLELESYDAAHGVCIFNTGGIKLIIESVASDAPDDEQILVGRFTGLSFHCDDIESKYHELKSAGVMFTGAPEKQFWGGWLATFVDPDGNEIQLVQDA